MAVDAEQEIDRLYGLALEEFTAARNALAKELRSAGQAEDAERVKALKKPSVAAGALNRAVRSAPDRLAEFLDAARELREAHEALMGGGEREAVDAASARERAAAAALVEEAGGSDSVRERVAATLRAAVADDEARAALEAGRLERELEAVGLGPFGGAAPRGGAKRGGAKKKRAPARREGDAAARRELKEARERERQAQRRARDAGQSVAAARERAEAAMEALERAQRDEAAAVSEAEAAAAEVEALERRVNQ